MPQGRKGILPNLMTRGLDMYEKTKAFLKKRLAACLSLD
jgi:hypothetical protein